MTACTMAQPISTQTFPVPLCHSNHMVDLPCQCRAHVSGGAVAVLGVDQHVTWSLSRASLLRNSAAGSGGALAFTVPVQGVLCQHCILHDNKAGLLGGALFSTARELCMSRRNQQVSMGGPLDRLHAPSSQDAGPMEGTLRRLVHTGECTTHSFIQTFIHGC